MLNVGLPELVLIAVLGLIVVGPDRLPGLARQAAKWLARFRTEAGRSLSELRAAADIEDVASEVSTLRAELRATRAELSRSLSAPARTAREVVKQVDPGGPGDHAGTTAGEADGPTAPPVDLEAT